MKSNAWRSSVAVDDDTRTIIKGSVTREADGAIVIRLPHRLESPNKMLHAHWRERTRDKQTWATRLRMAISNATNRASVAEFEKPYDALVQQLGFAPVTGHRWVTFERLVPSSRNFIRDRDNLVYSAKPLLDQVRKAGFLRDDSSKHITLEVTQRVSDDGRDWTVIRIEIPAGEALPLSAAQAARTGSAR